MAARFRHSLEYMKADRELLLVFLICLIASACDRTPASRSRERKKQAQQARLDWHRENLLGAYQTFGSQNTAWDAAAEKALQMFAEVRSETTPLNSASVLAIRESVSSAVAAGCNDPLINYLHIRYVMSDSGIGAVEFAQRMRAAADVLNLSEYNPLARFYGCLRAAEASAVDIGEDKALPEHVRRYRYAMSTNLIGVIRDRTTPPEDVYQAVHEWIATARRSPLQFEEDMKFVEPGLAGLGDRPLILLARAECAIAYGWNARGHGYADTVTSQAWQLFNTRLTTAKELLDQSWKNDPGEPRIATAMLDIAVGLSFKRKEMEKWFDRAMQLDTNNYSACEAKLHYLKPQWYGSPEEMLAFGRQCLSNQWGGSVPLILLDAHRTIVAQLPKEHQLTYWNDPDVWQDVDLTFKRFFSINPDAVSYRHNYAWYAYHAGEWRVFKEQLSHFKGTNYAYFGGKEQFDQMVAKAEAAAK
jgi:hypothetical protein